MKVEMKQILGPAFLANCTLLDLLGIVSSKESCMTVHETRIPTQKVPTTSVPGSACEL